MRGDVWYFIRSESEFRCFATDVDFEQNVDLSLDSECFPGKRLGDAETIDGLNHVEEFRRGSCLVRLQVSDQVPFNARKFNRANLAFRFLYAIFAEMPHSRVVSGLDSIDWHRFRNRHDCYIARVPIRGRGVLCDRTLDTCNVVGDEVKHWLETRRDVGRVPANSDDRGEPARATGLGAMREIAGNMTACADT